MKKMARATVGLVSLLMLHPWSGRADSLEPAGPPGSPETAMKSLNEVEPRTLISALPFMITNSGSYYVVGNLVGTPGTNGITITASHVQLDLNGFALIGSTNVDSGDNSTLAGVRISDDSPDTVNVTIRNGVIHNWGQEGIRSLLAKDSRITGITVSHNGTNGYDGMSLGSWWTITDCLAARNGGHGISAGLGCTVSRCVFRENVKCGLYVNDQCRIFDCNAMWNYQDGFRICNDGAIKNCFAIQNGSNGVCVGSGCVVTDCLASRNTNAGIEAGGDCRIEGNHVRNNHYGVQIPTGGDHTLVIHNSAVMNWTGCAFDLNTNTHCSVVLESQDMPRFFSNFKPDANFSLSPP